MPCLPMSLSRKVANCHNSFPSDGIMEIMESIVDLFMIGRNIQVSPWKKIHRICHRQYCFEALKTRGQSISNSKVFALIHPRSSAIMATSKSYKPNEPSSDILLEQTFLAGDFICGVGFGIQIVLFFSCAIYLWKQRRTVPKAMFLLAYITLLMCIETIFEAVQARTVQVIYVDNREYPGGPWQYFLATQSLPINVIFIACLFVLAFLSDLLVLWRCWVIWLASGRTVAYAVVAFPAVMLLASFVMGTLWTLQSSQPGLSFYSSLPLAYGTSYYAISLGVNIILTILISVRLLMYRYKLKETLGEEHMRNYISLLTIIIESAALYSLFAILFLITYAVNNPTNQVFLGLASSAQQIAGYLIIYRVAQGRAFKKDTFANTTLPTINFQAGQKSTHDMGSTATHLGVTSSIGRELALSSSHSINESGGKQQ